MKKILIAVVVIVILFFVIKAVSNKSVMDIKTNGVGNVSQIPDPNEVDSFRKTGTTPVQPAR